MTPTHDFVGIGIGPFNLGLACLTAPLSELDGIFLDERDSFSWHPGLMIDGVTIQLPFLADLVTMADPTSAYSFLNYLKATGRLCRFYIREDFYPLRAEYQAYCQWVTDQLPNLQFGTRVAQITYDEPERCYLVHTRRGGQREVLRARRLVLGIGTEPWLPAPARDLAGPAIHSADYLPHREELRSLDSVTIIGSGQSAAEIYLDLLQAGTPGHLNWVTRSPRFFPMEYTKLSLELTSPDYIDYFHALPATGRGRLNREQRHLYKGINGALINQIYDTLYRRELGDPAPTTLLTGVTLTAADWQPADSRYQLRLRHEEQAREFTLRSQGLILATGYQPRTPGFLAPVHDRIRWDEYGRFQVSRGYAVDLAEAEIFVQNAEEHTHSLTAPDLGMGAYRNSVIIAAMLGKEIYPIERSVAFQRFGAPEPAGSELAG